MKRLREIKDMLLDFVSGSMVSLNCPHVERTENYPHGRTIQYVFRNERGELVAKVEIFGEVIERPKEKQSYDETLDNYAGMWGA